MGDYSSYYTEYTYAYITYYTDYNYGYTYSNVQTYNPTYGRGYGYIGYNGSLTYYDYGGSSYSSSYDYVRYSYGYGSTYTTSYGYSEYNPGK